MGCKRLALEARQAWGGGLPAHGQYSARTQPAAGGDMTEVLGDVRGFMGGGINRKYYGWVEPPSGVLQPGGGGGWGGPGGSTGMAGPRTGYGGQVSCHQCAKGILRKAANVCQWSGLMCKQKTSFYSGTLDSKPKPSPTAARPGAPDRHRGRE